MLLSIPKQHIVNTYYFPVINYSFIPLQKISFKDVSFGAVRFYKACYLNYFVLFFSVRLKRHNNNNNNNNNNNLLLIVRLLH